MSVNLNKIALIRNSREGNNPDILSFAIKAVEAGAQGITVHPRPDQRHIKYKDVSELKDVIKTEFNIEGNPSSKFIDLVLDIKPTQVTLVPDADEDITSSAGWDTLEHQDFLKKIINQFKGHGIRTSIFVDPKITMVEGAHAIGADRIELYTGAYASGYYQDKDVAIKPYVMAAEKAMNLGIGVNAGHDLNLDNLAFFAQNIPALLEVSIGHALICESLYLGFENIIPMYLQRLSI